jgi:hypothetical protein
VPRISTAKIAYRQPIVPVESISVWFKTGVAPAKRGSQTLLHAPVLPNPLNQSQAQHPHTPHVPVRLTIPTLSDLSPAPTYRIEFNILDRASDNMPISQVEITVTASVPHLKGGTTTQLYRSST